LLLVKEPPDFLEVFLFIDNSLEFHTNRVFSSHSWDCPIVRSGNKALMNSAPKLVMSDGSRAKFSVGARRNRNEAVS
jgi:hypothetical protein